MEPIVWPGWETSLLPGGGVAGSTATSRQVQGAKAGAEEFETFWISQLLKPLEKAGTVLPGEPALGRRQEWAWQWMIQGLAQEMAKQNTLGIAAAAGPEEKNP